MDALVQESLQKAALWDEVKDRLSKNAWGLSGGQQQRLCIARALAVKPEVLLMDEPASALDPGSTSKVEELMVELKENYTVVLVTHNMQQAARVGTNVAFLYKGDLVEFGPALRASSRTPRTRSQRSTSGETCSDAIRGLRQDLSVEAIAWPASWTWGWTS